VSRDLLAYLADRFVPQRENLATEALLFILERSEVARDSVMRLLVSLGCQLPSPLTYRSQVVGSQGETPDLVGIDPTGRESVLVEAKFWAGLTDHQPVTYLARLETVGGSALVFLAPERRLELLWFELARRIHESGRDVGSRRSPLPGAVLAPVGEVHLAVISWGCLLGFISEALAGAGERELLESLGQLQALCHREDHLAFLPLEGHELTSSLPRRLLQFGELIDETVARLEGSGLASTKRLRAAAGNGWFGRYLLLSGAGCLLQVNAANWAGLEMTPIWLRVTDCNWQVSMGLRIAFVAAQAAGHLRFHDRGTGLEVPIRLQPGMDREAALASMLGQIRDIASILEAAELPPLITDAGPPGEEPQAGDQTPTSEG